MTQHELKQVLINYCDFRGIQRSKVIPAHAKEAANRDGVGFAGFASWLDLTPADSDVIAIPDFGSEFVLPWRKEVSWTPSDLYMDGIPLDQCPRGLLKKVLSLFSDQGMTVKTGVEAEFFLLEKEVDSSIKLYDSADVAEKPCYSQSVLWSHFDFIAGVMDCLNSLGWDCYQADHEDANGQFEINWKYDEALKTADKHGFFKLAVKSIAEDYGARATFMPKPFNDLTGNGCHTHVSVWDASGANLFEPSRSLGGTSGLSELGQSFVAGILKHARSLSCFLNPSVNSYKRLYCSNTRSGSSWASNRVSFGGNDRSVMIRVPEEGRFELRQPDGAVNPYLSQAAICAAGWIGLRDKMDISGVVTELDSKNATLPNSLEDALRDLEKDEELTTVLGREFVGKYVRLKMLEVDESRSQVTPWEIESYLDV